MVFKAGNPSKLRHGHSRRGAFSLTYNAWYAMLRRCRTTQWAQHHRYAGRGITVCDRWRAFDSFLADMGEKPAGMTLERKDNDGNYEPGNCVWRGRSAQARNRVTTVSKETADAIKASSLSATKAAKVFGVSRPTVKAIRNGFGDDWRV